MLGPTGQILSAQKADVGAETSLLPAHTSRNLDHRDQPVLWFMLPSALLWPTGCKGGNSFCRSRALIGKTEKDNGVRSSPASKWGCLGCAMELHVTFADADW